MWSGGKPGSVWVVSRDEFSSQAGVIYEGVRGIVVRQQAEVRIRNAGEHE